MANKKICDVCHGKINGINNIANVVGESVLCSQCYEKLVGFRTTKKYNNIEEVQADKTKYLALASRLEYPESVIRDLTSHFDQKEKKLVDINQIDHYLVSTCHTLEGYIIEEYLGVVTGQIVLGSGLFSSFNATFADWTGGEASRFSEKLDEAEKYAKNKAIYKSLLLGGNALIGVDVEYTTILSNLLGVIVSGTSVKVRRKED